jgi:glutaminase
MDIQKVLNEIYKEIKPLLGKGKVADYIPELAKANPKDFAMSVITLDGKSYHIGEYKKRFSIQSISKVYTFAMALKMYSKRLYQRVGVEPSGTPFNSLVQLEYEKGKPRNPFINAGALVVTDSLITHYKDEFITLEHILSFLRQVSHTQDININPDVAKSEMKHGYRNRALANLIKDFNNLDNDPITVVETYFKQCAVEMNTFELANSTLFLANRGTDPISNKAFLSPIQAKRVNAVMLTCGHYDASGEFAFHVGLPGKSGVGGGIIALVPQKMGICVYSPPLNEYGNSYAGTIALELFTKKTGLSIF